MAKMVTSGDLISRDSADGRGLAFLIHADGSAYTDYERGYNDAVVSYYSMVQNAPAVEAEPVVHAHWTFYEDETGDWYDKCSRCGGKLPNEGGYCCGLPRCPECGAHMDEEVADG